MSEPAIRSGMHCAGRLYGNLIFLGLDRMRALGRELFARELAMAPGGGAFVAAAKLTAPRAVDGHDGADRQRRVVAVAARKAGQSRPRPNLDRAHARGRPVAYHYGASRRRTRLRYATRRASGAGRPARRDRRRDDGAPEHRRTAKLGEMRGVVAGAKQSGLTVSVDCSWTSERSRRPACSASSQGSTCSCRTLRKS